jgi:hypothetical protein
MEYVFQGKLCGHICPECSEALSNVLVRLYRSRSKQPVTALAVAEPKETLEILTDKQVVEKSGYLIAEERADENGQFTFELGSKQKYEGEAFEIDVYLDTVPNASDKEKKTLQFTITTLQPRWRQAEHGLVYKWGYCLPARFWCAIRARFDTWVICGTVVSCDTNSPIAGVRVRAFDVDWIQDDPLGSAVTDAAGHFRIDYSSIDFRQTPFSPSINFEWIGGPDVYFHVETTTGSPLLTESPSIGRTSARENIGTCFCVSLCLKKVPPEEIIPTIPLFTNVGQYSVDSDPLVSDFASDGTTKNNGYAFTGTIPLIGILPDGTAADPVKYRFRYAKHPALVSISNADGSIIEKTKIGRLEYFSWNSMLSIWEVKARDYFINHSGSPQVSIPQNGGPNIVVSLNKPIAIDGWIEVPTENELYPGGKGRFIPSERLANFNTKKLTDEFFDLTVSSAPLPLKAGDPIPAAQKSEAPTFRIFFEAEKVSLSTPVSSNELDVIALSNTLYKYDRHPAWAGVTVTTRTVTSLEIAEMIGAGATGCDTMINLLHALYTTYHPYLADTRIYFEGNAPLPSTFIATIVSGEATHGLPGEEFNISGMDPCAYILWMRTEVNLSDGWGQVDHPYNWDRIAFCISE